MLTLNLSI